MSNNISSFDFNSTPLFILEMANNHMGDFDHGINIIQKMSSIVHKYPFRFAMKFQYRDLDTFIHPKYQTRYDLKYVKRFNETRLTKEQFKLMRDELAKQKFLAICTPFDEASVDLVLEHLYDVIKIASCSFTDWPLLEKIATTSAHIPIIASTAGATLEEIDRVVTFFSNRNRKLCLMHCVGEYPTLVENLQLNQIDLFKQRYKDIAVGFSTHEDPENFDSIKIAIAKGATLFERHVGVATSKYALNQYSSTPEQVEKWLAAARTAWTMSGVQNERRSFSEKEMTDLRGLKRGLFVKENITIKKGQTIKISDLTSAIPNEEDQLLANDFSKYVELISKTEISANEPILKKNIEIKDLRKQVSEIVTEVKKILHMAKINIQDRADVDISHHYGIEHFHECGATIINCINREYCKKIIVLLPGQSHPVHYHLKKEETFHILYGPVTVKIADKEKTYNAGDLLVVERGVKHSFSSEKGGVFEEISTTHVEGDSYYDDAKINLNSSRKIHLTFFANWFQSPTL
ncbi:MAG: N-acetylneuraminate synthase family protein [Oligoflexia bacterium]|nr:N-acetylneuraminate synthase family protein [Oligoflexia bacterium]